MRRVLASLLVLGTAGLVLVPQPGSFLIALLVMLAVFLLGAARLAIDLIELRSSELAADVTALAAIGAALTQIPVGNVRLTELLFIVALTAQALPRLRVAMANGPSASPPPGIRRTSGS